MTSPFPGMDPYLENSWGDVHQSLITYARDQLQERLPRGLRARTEQRIAISPLDDGPRREFIPDVHVVEQAGPRRAAAAVAVEPIEAADPVILLVDEGATEGFIEIVEVGSEGRVITVIEVLSPSNKRRGPDQDKYLDKQRGLADGRVSLVEIDLLREGDRVLGHRGLRIPKRHRTAYQACVHRGWRPISFELDRIPLRKRLPAIRIPLREADADVTLDLQALVDLAYRNGRYDDGIDYRSEPDPPLAPPDAGWADALLKEKGLR